MAFFNKFLGLNNFPKELQLLSIKYISLQATVSGIYLSYAWISLYYINKLGSYSLFGIIVSIGMLIGAGFDIPLGILTDKFGQRLAFCSALFCLASYYIGIIFAVTPLEFLILEVIVGIYSALLSGSYISWFMNSWEYFSPNEDKSIFRSIMGSLNFTKTLIVSGAILLGGLLLQEKNITPEFIFFFQALISILGIILGFKFIKNPQLERDDVKQSPKLKNNSNTHFVAHSKSLSLKQRYFHVIPYFLSFSLIGFTSTSFNTIIFIALLYDEIFGFKIVGRPIYNFADIATLLASITLASSDLIYAIACRFSGHISQFSKSSVESLIKFYFLNYPVIWCFYIILLLLEIPTIVKVLGYIILFLIKVIISGLATGFYWEVYYQITSPKYRSSQESVYNTVNLLISLIGFTLIGNILDSLKFFGGLSFLFSISLIGLIILKIAIRN
ncbi:MFS transporter [Candidatus Hodarchaeum mangrovi]